MIHGITHVRRGHPEDLLWTCHLGALGVGLGLIGRWSLIVTIGVEWLVVGNIIWLAEMFLGGLFLHTTLLTHVLGLVLGLAGLRTLGVVEGAWRLSAVAVVALYAVTWFGTPRNARVNLTHGIRPGLERFLPSYAVYIATIFLGCLAVFAATEEVLLRFGFPVAG